MTLMMQTIQKTGFLAVLKVNSKTDIEKFIFLLALIIFKISIMIFGKQYAYFN
jgi:hypothetical protein